MGKMACCLKAIFRWKWGLSESGLMAVGVVPLCWEHHVGKAQLQPQTSLYRTPLLSYPLFVMWRSSPRLKSGNEPNEMSAGKMPRFVPFYAEAEPDREETGQGQAAPLRPWLHFCIRYAFTTNAKR